MVSILIQVSLHKIACHGLTRLATVVVGGHFLPYEFRVVWPSTVPSPVDIRLSELDRRSPPRARFAAIFLAFGFSLVFGALLAVLGCRAMVPIHVWQPPGLASIDGNSVVLMKIQGTEETAAAIRQELLAHAEQTSDRVHADRLSLIVPERLQAEPTIRLVSGAEPVRQSQLDSDSSDLEVAAMARQRGIDQLLRGEVIEATGQEGSVERLAMVWRLVGLTPDAVTTGIPVSVNQEMIRDKHPDLLPIVDPRVRLQKAIVRETVSLLSASVKRYSVTLANPRMTIGSRRVREGNELARQGNWPMAEKAWTETIDRYPGQTAAWINASIASVARQDFAEARERASRAITLSAFMPINRSLAEETLVWIELRQREYHEAFTLPDPPEGWRITQVATR